MMAELFLHNRCVKSVFELLGTKENHITYSLGWALTHCPELRTELLRRVFPRAKSHTAELINLQQRDDEVGITDIEIVGDDVHMIVEAKRGWELPSDKQLSLYTPRLNKQERLQKALVTMSECTREYAALHQSKMVDGVPVRHFSWRDVQKLCANQGSHAAKRLAREFRTYLERIVKMQKQESNMVFIVVLSAAVPEGAKLSWIRIVEEAGRYFHPVGNGWPKEPPNYIGFRYKGMLQSIRHVESWKIMDDIHDEIPGYQSDWTRPHFVYRLGPKIVPPHVVKTGSIFRNGRVWAMLDLLLTCKTIVEARDITKQRQSAD